MPAKKRMWRIRKYLHLYLHNQNGRLKQNKEPTRARAGCHCQREHWPTCKKPPTQETKETEYLECDINSKRSDTIGLQRTAFEMLQGSQEHRNVYIKRRMVHWKATLRIC